ncbi:hypothetical protein X949_5986 [Burkholderia pseudomallei MSHR5609]|nr:hypothetical protein X949_5986 [Burkholderia pseudomallei MSHR5609]
MSPLSGWCIKVPSSPGWRAYSACSSASRTKSVLIDELTRQPTMRRANRSITMILRSWAFMRSIEFV